MHGIKRIKFAEIHFILPIFSRVHFFYLTASACFYVTKSI